MGHLSLSAAVLVGLVGRVYLTTPLIGADSEKVFMIMAQEMFPTILTGFLLAAILSAIMSTADSQLLVSASALSEDFIKPFYDPKLAEKNYYGLVV